MYVPQVPHRSALRQPRDPSCPALDERCIVHGNDRVPAIHSPPCIYHRWFPPRSTKSGINCNKNLRQIRECYRYRVRTAIIFTCDYVECINTFFKHYIKNIYNVFYIQDNNNLFFCRTLTCPYCIK